MKVGIITFHRAVNYGAVLQAYALQHAIEKLGYEAYIIDYRCKEVDKAASPLLGFRSGDSFKTATKKLVFRLRKNMAFNSFMRKYVNLSPKTATNHNLEKMSDEYDAFFTGSDQVWNCRCSGNDETFFLNFVKDGKKKNAYAASFGTEKLFEDDPFDYKTLLADFNSISVREKSGVDIVVSESGRKAQVTLDPTLLLSKEEWKPAVGKRPIKEKYIFVYYIRESKDLLNYAGKLSEKTGYKVINAKNSKEFFLKCSPSDFLAWIYYAEYFVTNSFHGTVFSLLFNKKFAIELDNGKTVNNRSKELLELVGVDRTLAIDNIDLISKETDYTAVEKIIEAERAKSIDFIINAVTMEQG